MIIKRATLLAIKVYSSSSSINHAVDSIKTLTSLKNFTTTATQTSYGYNMGPLSNNGNNGFDSNSSDYGKHPSLYNGYQNGVEFHHSQRVSPPSVGTKTNGNFGGYYRQSYAVSPQQSRNGGSYGRSDAGYQVVNGNCNPNVGQLHQTAGASYTGNVGMNEVNRSSYQISNGGFAYNNIGQNGNIGGTHDGPPQHNPNMSYGQIDARYQGSVNRNSDPNVGQLHQTAGASYTGNVGMNQMKRSSYQVSNGGFDYNNIGQYGNIRGTHDGPPQQNRNMSYGQIDAGYQGSVNRNSNPNVGQLHQAAGDSYTGNVGMSHLNSSYQISNGGLQNGNFGGYDKQSYVMSPQQSPNGLYSGSYGRSHDGNQGVVNGYCNSNVGQFNQTVDDSYMGNVSVNQLNRSLYQFPNGGIPNGNFWGYYGNFGGYYLQSYVVLPLQNPNGSYNGSYGPSDVVYQVVNRNYNPNVGQYHQTAGDSFMGNVGYQVVNGNPNVGQFHQTLGDNYMCNIGTNQLNRSSRQIPSGGITYNIIGQNGNLAGYDRQSYAVLPQQSPNGPCNGSYGRSDLAYQVVNGNCNPNVAYQVVNRNCNPNVGQFHQTAGGSYMGNDGMNQQNMHQYQILNNGNCRPHQSRSDQRSENVGVQTQNSYYRNNGQNIQPNQFANVGNYSNPNNFQQKQRNPNDYSRNNGESRQNNRYQQKPKDQVSLNSMVDKCFRNTQPRANDDSVGSTIKTASKDKISGRFHQYASTDSQVSRCNTVEAFPPKEYKGTVEEFDEFCKEGKVKDAIEVLKLLQKQQISIDLPRYMCLVKACGEAKALEEAKAIHKIMTESISPFDVSTCNQLLEMYSRCGSMLDAYGVFHSMTDRNLASWTILITWLAKNELPEDAINMFKQFKKSKIKPDGDIFFGVFSACGALGKAKEGMLHFDNMMNEYNIVPTMKHFASIVDMLGNSGNIAEALEFIEKMPIEPSDDVYETLMKQFSAPEKCLQKGGFSTI